ncbi:MAG: glucose 1-dehydrogenase [Gammaproteobacteria bacterium]|jgi:3(or 17)beta-hydroxysteroid dehydrogenase|nr:glucose 1-dehydrogenase [Gammaproteobacteria bacterium]MDG1233019.1 glucose 1-dehydrogenase [Pseudomonadales bacterium]MBT5153959.1 glucose 1-dehydrogenase [Gammaproteobacteria bacterium]MBT5685567.1 glucose 1-dehydrogenase [Gammaproteobacteria bacterium]MBT5725092.1 glucose 1-dehydrogenase [Gammaproteobacteria bacterium]
MGRLNDKIAIVTGGASGLGAGIAQRFVEEGALTIITDINPEGEAVAERLGAEFLTQDVSAERSWVDTIDEVLSRFGRLDVLVNNAGIFSSSPVDETQLEDWQRVMDVNLTGVFLGCKHAVRAMKKNTGATLGSIVNLSSVVGLRGQLGGAAYGASKGGVRLLTKTVALENAAISIRCNSIHPGIIDTPIMDPIFAAVEDPAALRHQIEQRLPIGYIGDPARDIGNMAVFLATDESVYITGAEMVVDGGMTIGLP